MENRAEYLPSSRIIHGVEVRDGVSGPADWGGGGSPPKWRRRSRLEFSSRVRKGWSGRLTGGEVVQLLLLEFPAELEEVSALLRFLDDPEPEKQMDG